LGTLLPFVVGLVIVNGMDPVGLIICFAFYYILSGIYFKVTTAVQPMKVIAAYAVATGITAVQLQASCIWVFLFLVIIGGSGMITRIAEGIPKAVVRGIQLSTGMLLLTQGVRLISGSSKLQALSQAAEPFLNVQSIWGIPVGLAIGLILGCLALLLLENRRFPAALAILGIGILISLLIGTKVGLKQIAFGVHMPVWLPYGLPSQADISFALLILVLPQIPMTLGNAVVANADLTKQYFPESSRRVTYRSLCISMALAAVLSFFLGGVPMCHGAGGLASHYRFGARTAGSNLIIGTILLLLSVFLGPHALALIRLLPMAALGILLVFAGLELSMVLVDVRTRKDLFVSALILGITLASNLAAGFLIGLAIAHLLNWRKLSI